MKTDQDIKIPETKKRKRSTTRYWVEIKGSLYARLQYKAENGKYQVKYKAITDKRTAKRVVEDMRKELETHGEELFLSDKMTVDELVNKYEEVELVKATYQNGIKIRGRRSVGSVKSAIKPLREFFGKRTVRSIKPSDLKTYKNKRLDTPVEIEVNVKTKVKNEETGKERNVITKEKRTRERKIATVNRELAWLRAILNFGVNNEWLHRNPFIKAKGIISTAAEVERERILSFAEEERLLSACTEGREHLRAIIICALDTAMRRGEILQICWREVNLEAGEIYVRKEISKTGYDRTVGITERLKTELDRLWKASPQDKNVLVFGIKTDFSGAFETARNKVNLEDFRFHDCRHTATTRMIASGSPHVEVMKITGHKQIKNFLRYLNITPETSRKVANRLDNYLCEELNTEAKSSNNVS